MAQEEPMQKYTEHMYKEVCPKRTLLQNIQESALLGKGMLYFKRVFSTGLGGKIIIIIIIKKTGKGRRTTGKEKVGRRKKHLFLKHPVPNIGCSLVKHIYNVSLLCNPS